VVIDPHQIQEVGVNIILNAIDAMPDGGTLTVRTRPVDGKDSKWVEFEISDSGRAISPEDLEHIFDPFFTTKPAGEGTGLGLAISYGIVSEHGGESNVISELNRGTTGMALPWAMVCFTVGYIFCSSCCSSRRGRCISG